MKLMVNATLSACIHNLSKLEAVRVEVALNLGGSEYHEAPMTYSRMWFCTAQPVSRGRKRTIT
ncbi:hypothetical protein M378DRAFT_292046 [Amanita muscaria Koide BX008]|uniref:Uncharacterized protein n=1 Tax=Amanita muscaria (strain Koide BX008) TaxID=946122 RepID=A0A0C2S7U8_AMAMK|nr:hypothetical protein M378DRAFT_292046 [Amanita muscaria Koide BX008]